MQIIQNQYKYLNRMKQTVNSLGSTTDNAEYKSTVNKHSTFLSKFNQFPEKTRKSIYKQLLLLPMNDKHFQQLSKPYLLLPEHNLDKHVSYICQCLTSIYPELGNQWVPGMIHPFVKLFKGDSVCCFEISLTFLLNYLAPILEQYPEPNKSITAIFQQHLSQLTTRVEELDYPLSAVISPAFTVTLTDILNRDDWLTMCDYLVTHANRPWLYFCIPLVILKSIENKLIKLKSVEDIAIGIRRQKKLHMPTVFSQAEKIQSTFLKQFQQIYVSRYFPLPRGRYPVYCFIKDKIRMTNAKVEHADDQQIVMLNIKMKELEHLLHRNINQGLLADQKDINDRYELVEGQMQQYLEQIRKQHRNKVQALREIQANFNEQVRDHQDKRQPKNVLNAIQRRARLEKQIAVMLNEAKSIKAMEEEMVSRMNEVADIKKKQLIRKSKNMNK